MGVSLITPCRLVFPFPALSSGPDLTAAGDAGAVARLRNRTVMEAWGGWLDYCDQQHEKRDKLATAVTFWTHRELASAFAEFRLNVVEQQAVRLSLLHWQHANLSKVFQRWKEYKTRRAGLFGALITLACKWEQPLLADAFAAWQDFTAESKRIKVMNALLW